MMYRITENEYTMLNEQKGTVQNLSNVRVEFNVSSDGEPTKDTGIVLFPAEKRKFTLSGEQRAYVRQVSSAIDHNPSAVAVIENG